jgi:hypothetical protein
MEKRNTRKGRNTKIEIENTTKNVGGRIFMEKKDNTKYRKFMCYIVRERTKKIRKL